MGKSPINIPPKRETLKESAEVGTSGNDDGEGAFWLEGREHKFYHHFSCLSEKEGGEEENKLSIKWRWMKKQR